MNYSFENNIVVINGNKLEIPNVKIIKTIGSGANGLCFKAETIVPKRNVALKIWLPRKGFDYPDKKRFINEINKIAEFNQQEIIQIFLADSIGGYFYAIYELVDGITLKQWLNQKKQPIDYRLSVLKQLGDLITGMCEIDIYHGDLHSKNILIKDFYKVKVIDFGTSIFSGRQNSKERDKKMIYETFSELFPEIIENRLINKYCPNYTQLNIVNGYIILSEILLLLSSERKLDEHDMFSISALIEMAKEEEIINLYKTSEFVLTKGVPKKYLEIKYS